MHVPFCLQLANGPDGSFPNINNKKNSINEIILAKNKKTWEVTHVSVKTYFNIIIEVIDICIRCMVEIVLKLISTAIYTMAILHIIY